MGTFPSLLIAKILLCECAMRFLFQSDPLPDLLNFLIKRLGVGSAVGKRSVILTAIWNSKSSP